MQSLVRASVASPTVQHVARRFEAGATARERAERIELFLRQSFVFVRDPLEMELVHAPEVMLWHWRDAGVIRGDCDDAAVLAATLARAMGLPAKFRAVGWRADGALEHVYTLVQADGEWYPLDVTKLPTVPAPMPKRLVEVPA